ncbi:hypothetical protein [Streptomyces sp. NPDC047028]|uniref:hypothetical protein n=1 Tax=Streptomyces sp. NPDC047028 TaxID=3155793 RepID=UPI0034006B5B
MDRSHAGREPAAPINVSSGTSPPRTAPVRDLTPGPGLVPPPPLPFGLGLAAATTVPQLLRVIPAGARVGQSLCGVIFVLATTVTGEGIKAGALAPVLTGGGVLLVCGTAMALLGKAVKRMRGEAV